MLRDAAIDFDCSWRIPYSDFWIWTSVVESVLTESHIFQVLHKASVWETKWCSRSRSHESMCCGEQAILPQVYQVFLGPYLLVDHSDIRIAAIEYEFCVWITVLCVDLLMLVGGYEGIWRNSTFVWREWWIQFCSWQRHLTLWCVSCLCSLLRLADGWEKFEPD